MPIWARVSGTWRSVSQVWARVGGVWRNLSVGSGDRGVFGGGYYDSYLSTIDYITISTLGNATLFGYLTQVRDSLATTSNT